VISKPGLRRLIKKHPQAENELLAWYKSVRAADWSSMKDVRVAFPSADRVGRVLVFNILHNELRLITVESFRSRRIFIKVLLTHKQYDRQEWAKWV